MVVANNGNRGVWNGWRFDQSAAKGAPADFSGLWLTDLGLMELVRDGAKYRGRYALRGVSTIEGDYLVGGHSQGGYLAYSLLMHSPEAVAGAFPISAKVIMENEPAVFTDEPLKANQRAFPLAIIHGKTDPNVAFSSGTYAVGLFLNAGWPAVR